MVRILTTQQIFHRMRGGDGYSSRHGFVRISRQTARADGQRAAFGVLFRILTLGPFDVGLKTESGCR